MNEGFDKEGSTINSRWWEINLINAKDDFTQANFIPLLVRITRELFRYYKNLKTQFFTRFSYTKELFRCHKHLKLNSMLIC